MPCIVSTSLYDVARQEVLVRRRELRAHEQREHAARDEEDERRADVEDPEPLVVGRREPPREAVAAPVGAVGGLSSRSPLGLEPLRVREERVDLLVRPGAADRGHRADALADERLEPVAVGERRVARERRADERRCRAGGR